MAIVLGTTLNFRALAQEQTVEGVVRAHFWIAGVMAQASAFCDPRERDHFRKVERWLISQPPEVVRMLMTYRDLTLQWTHEGARNFNYVLNKDGESQGCAVAMALREQAEDRLREGK